MPVLLEYKCPNCDGSLEFDSNTQQMKCPYCDSLIDVAALKQYEDEAASVEEKQIEWGSYGEIRWDQNDGINVYICESCGGEIVGDENLAASTCPFCGNRVVMQGQLSGDLKPDYIIPFKLDKNMAKQAFSRHLMKKTLLPKVFKSQNHIDEIKGVYVPFWLFNCDTDSEIWYRATRIRSWSDSMYNYTETSFYRVLRAGNIGFERIPVDGSSKLANDLMESVEPYDWNGAVEFQPAYLAGYMADKYDVPSNICNERANQRVRQSTTDAFRETVHGYSSVTPEISNINLKNGSVKYAMYPVWLLNTTWKDEKFVFAMNGQTGKFVGNLPLDKGAYARWFILITVIAGLCVYGLAWLLRILEII